MKQLLESEGINIENDKVINFDKVFGTQRHGY